MNEITVIVERGHELPQRNKHFRVSSCLTDTQYDVRVRDIRELRWNSNGDLVIVIRGTKTAVTVHPKGV